MEHKEIGKLMSGTSDIRLSAIGQIALTVHDLEAATRYYRDVLGMQHLFEAPGMSFFQCGDVRLMLGNPQGVDHPSSVIYYRVEDIHTAYEILRERGVKFEQEPLLVHKTDEHELWLAFFRDVDGHMLALMSEMPVD
jgi:methylmalonyl-CoA/ethylmalonyl-CoA epimerase